MSQTVFLYIREYFEISVLEILSVSCIVSMLYLRIACSNCTRHVKKEKNSLDIQFHLQRHYILSMLPEKVMYFVNTYLCKFSSFQK